MKLSIIIVNYNTYHLTKQTIDSIINKTYSFRYEIILIDNVLSDGSIEALEEDFKLEQELIHKVAAQRSTGRK